MPADPYLFQAPDFQQIAVSQLLSGSSVIADLENRVAVLEARVADLQQGSFTGTWAWQSSPLLVATEVLPPPTKPTAGLDTDSPAQATKLFITPADENGSDFSGALQRLQNGDGLLIWERTNSANRLRYDVATAGALSGPYFILPVTNTLSAGAEPGNSIDVNIQLLFAA